MEMKNDKNPTLTIPVEPSISTNCPSSRVYRVHLPPRPRVVAYPGTEKSSCITEKSGRRQRLSRKSSCTEYFPHFGRPISTKQVPELLVLASVIFRVCRNRSRPDIHTDGKNYPTVFVDPRLPTANREQENSHSRIT
jgi:hypothetical protein